MAGKVAPFMFVYGMKPGSSRLIWPIPPDWICTIRRWKNWTWLPMNWNLRETGIAELVDSAALLEVVPDLVVGDAEAGLGEVPRIGGHAPATAGSMNMDASIVTSAIARTTVSRRELKSSPS